MKIFTIVFLVAALAGCSTFTPPRYSISADNNVALKKIGVGNVFIGDFQGPAKFDNFCRGAGPINPPDKKSFEGYIQKAFADELKLAGMYDAKSPRVTITGKVNSLEFSSSRGLTVDRAPHRHCYRGDLAPQLADRDAEALAADVLKALVDRGAEPAVQFRLLDLDLVQHCVALGRRAGGEKRAPDRGLRDRHRRADVGQHGERVAVARGLHVDHVEAIANAHRHRAVAVVGQVRPAGLGPW